eukprot:15439813-Alexandrium_andersonii.AAC.1
MEKWYTTLYATGRGPAQFRSPYRPRSPSCQGPGLAGSPSARPAQELGAEGRPLTGATQGGGGRPAATVALPALLALPTQHGAPGARQAGARSCLQHARRGGSSPVPEAPT